MTLLYLLNSPLFTNDLNFWLVHVLQDVRQSQIETVVPSTEGTPVQVLLGKYAGRRGRLLQRNASTGLAAVQFTSDLSVHKLSLDDIAEYCGDTESWDE